MSKTKRTYRVTDMEHSCINALLAMLRANALNNVLPDEEGNAVCEIANDAPAETKPANPAPYKDLSDKIAAVKATIPNLPASSITLPAVNGFVPVAMPAARVDLKPIPNIPGLTTGSLLLARAEREPLTRPSGKL